jgi:hypothetical protein
LTGQTYNDKTRFPVYLLGICPKKVDFIEGLCCRVNERPESGLNAG